MPAWMRRSVERVIETLFHRLLQPHTVCRILRRSLLVQLVCLFVSIAAQGTVLAFEKQPQRVYMSQLVRTILTAAIMVETNGYRPPTKQPSWTCTREDYIRLFSQNEAIRATAASPVSCILLRITKTVPPFEFRADLPSDACRRISRQIESFLENYVRNISKGDRSDLFYRTDSRARLGDWRFRERARKADLATVCDNEGLLFTSMSSSPWRNFLRGIVKWRIQ